MLVRRWWVVFGLSWICLAQSPAIRILPERFLDHIQFLASSELRGRLTGSPESERAARYIAAQFRQAGLEPLTHGYFQSFPVGLHVSIGQGNSFEYCFFGDCVALHLQENFIPLNFSGSGSCEGTPVFVGYGISAPELNYDDYAGVDVRGRIVLMLRHEPQEFDDRSRFAGRLYTEHSQSFSKALEAARRGACGVVMVNDVANHGGQPGSLEEFVGTVAPADPGIPFVQVDAETVRRWFQWAGRDLDEVERQIDSELRSASFVFPESLKLRFRTELHRVERMTPNVAGYLPGRTAEYVILGAHYDHIGLGEQFSLAPEQAGAVHPGADDNASGVAGLLELAHYFATRPRLRRGILFLAFSGEELGLLGSGYFARHPLLPPEYAVAMINLDMIGRLRDKTVYVGGLETSPDWEPLLARLRPSTDLRLDLSGGSAYGASDHSSFTNLSIPVLFFFTGLHADYHRPADTWDKITAAESARLLEFVALLVEHLAEDAARPRFQILH